MNSARYSKRNGAEPKWPMREMTPGVVPNGVFCVCVSFLFMFPTLPATP